MNAGERTRLASGLLNAPRPGVPAGAPGEPFMAGGDLLIDRLAAGDEMSACAQLKIVCGTDLCPYRVAPWRVVCACARLQRSRCRGGHFCGTVCGHRTERLLPLCDGRVIVKVCGVQFAIARRLGSMRATVLQCERAVPRAWRVNSTCTYQ